MLNLVKKKKFDTHFPISETLLQSLQTAKRNEATTNDYAEEKSTKV